MTKSLDNENLEHLDDAPAWLRDALATKRVSPQFSERCREAALVAYSMAAMRNLRTETGLIPETLEQYVKDLARVAGVKLEPVLRWLGLKSLAHPDVSQSRSYARLGKALGMDKGDLMRHIAATFSISEGVPILALGKTGCGKIATSSAELLDELEANLSWETKQKLHLIQDEIAKEYDSDN